MELNKTEITALAECLASGYDAYRGDHESAYPISWFICESRNQNLYVEGVFNYTPENTAAYICDLVEAPDLLSENIDGFIHLIENAEWYDEGRGE